VSGTEFASAEPFRLSLEIPSGSPEAFEQWRFGVAPLFAMDAPSAAERDRFHLSGASYQFSGLAVASVRSSPTVFDRGGRVIARSGLDQIDVITYLAGGCRLTVEGRETEVNTGDILLLDMTRPCRLLTSSYHHLSILLPRADIESFLPDAEMLHGLVLPHGTPLNTLLMSHMRTLYSEAPSFRNGDGDAAVRATAGLVAACADRSGTGGASAPFVKTSLAARRVRLLIQANLSDPHLGPEFLVKHGGVSRSTLYRLFEPMGGVRRYIRQRRLNRAFRLLSNPAQRGERIGSIASRCGFENDAVFSRAMRQAYRMSPSEVRAAASDDTQLAPNGDEGSTAFRDMNYWLAGFIERATRQGDVARTIRE
jgi:AraC-like DNA-binding protein